jgi:4'-phosphopantetheinyl transferase
MIVTVYEIDLSAHNADVFLPFLSEEDKALLSFYLFEKEKKRFAVRRGALRVVLSQILNIAPEKIQIYKGAQGKPETVGVFFNTSYAEDKLLIAVSDHGPVGIDIEKFDESFWSMEAEDAVFSNKEKFIAASLSLQMRKEYFFHVWTKKEAWLKGLGEGILKDLKTYDTQECNWHFTLLNIQKPFIASVATLTICQLQNGCFSSHLYTHLR